MMPQNGRARICFVGPMLGVNAGWVPNPMEALAPKLESREYRCILTSRKVPRLARWRDTVATLIRERGSYDVICLQVYSGRSFLVEDSVSRLAGIMGKPIVMVLHGGAMPRFCGRFPGWTRAVLSRAAVLVTPSEFLWEMVRAIGLDAVVIPNLVPLDDYTFRHRERVRPRLLWMRTFHELYNPEMAVRVLARVRAAVLGSTMTMAGQEKGLLARTRALANELGLGEAIAFPGFAGPDIKRRLFDGHDIFLNTNRVDNMPVSVLEACASGLPVVATRVGGIPNLLSHAEEALLVPDGDAEAMAQAVLRLMREPGLAARLSVAGRKVAERSDWEKVGPRWEAVFARAVD